MILSPVHFLLIAATASDKVPSLQELEAFAAEERRKRALPLDCLAGVCLGDPEVHPTEKVVSVAGEVVNRGVVFCGGQVVMIQAFQAWSDIPSESPWVQYDSGDFPQSVGRVKFLLMEQSKLGWEVSPKGKKEPEVGKYWEEVTQVWKLSHPGKQGDRALIKTDAISQSRATGKTEIQFVKVTVFSTHPDYDALCASKRQEGL